MTDPQITNADGTTYALRIDGLTPTPLQVPNVYAHFTDEDRIRVIQQEIGVPLTGKWDEETNRQFTTWLRVQQGTHMGIDKADGWWGAGSEASLRDHLDPEVFAAISGMYADGNYQRLHSRNEIHGASWEEVQLALDETMRPDEAVNDDLVGNATGDDATTEMSTDDISANADTAGAYSGVLPWAGVSAAALGGAYLIFRNRGLGAEAGRSLITVPRMDVLDPDPPRVTHAPRLGYGQVIDVDFVDVTGQRALPAPTGTSVAIVEPAGPPAPIDVERVRPTGAAIVPIEQVPIEQIDNMAAAARAARLEARGARLVKMGLVTTVVATGAALTLIGEAHSTQRDIAELLAEQRPDVFPPEALAEYLALNRDIENVYTADTAANQFPLTVPLGIAATESYAEQQFAAFSNKWNLPQDIHEMLGMSLFDGPSLRGGFALAALEIIPEQEGELPPELQSLWQMKQDLETAQNALDDANEKDFQTQYAYDEFGDLPPWWPSESEREERIENATSEVTLATSTFQKEFDRLLSDPDTSHQILAMIPQDVLMEMVEGTARYQTGDHHPLIRQLGELQRRSDESYTTVEAHWALEQEILDIKKQLNENSEMVYAYILDVFGTGEGEYPAYADQLDDEQEVSAAPVSPETQQIRTAFATGATGWVVNPPETTGTPPKPDEPAV